MKSRLTVIFVLTLFLAPACLVASEFMIFPAQGQDQAQMEKDQSDCYGWATQQSGFDPQTMSAPSSQGKEYSTGKAALKKGAGGALVGAGIGAIAGGSKGAKKGAAIGGVSGGVIGGAKEHEKKKEAQNQQAQESARYEQLRQSYQRAFQACMEGKGYTLK